MVKYGVVAGLMLAGSAHAAVVLNPSMETTSQLPGSGYVYQPTDASWSFTGGAGITKNSTAWGFANAPDGTNVAFLQNTAQISQTVTGLLANRNYTVTYDLSSRPGYANNAVTTSFAGTNLTVTTPTNGWTGVDTFFNSGAATSGVLAFSTSETSGDHDSGLDNIAVQLARGVINGSFESTMQLPALGYLYGVTDAGWTFSGGSGITRNNTAWGFPSTPEGMNVAFLQNVSSVSQTVGGLTAGRNYKLIFSTVNRPGYGLNPIDVAFGAQNLGTVNSAASWARNVIGFTASSNTALLSFSTGATSGDHGVGLDAVRIAAVPEPASWAMFLSGFGLLGMAMRRRGRDGAIIA